jgi:predicted transcriptional regulator
MAGRKELAITERQFEVLRVLWEHGPQTVREMMEHLPRGNGQPYTTVLGLLQGMERTGLVEHEKEGLAHRYRPLVTRPAATGSLLSDFLDRFFHGSAEQMILGLVDSEQIGPDELSVIELKIDEAKRRHSARRKDADDESPKKKSRKSP